MDGAYHGCMARTNFAELNSAIRYTMWSVFRVEPERLPDERAEAGAETRDYLDSLADKGVVVRGVYDLAGLRADADYMIWWHAEEIEQLQAAYTGLRRTGLGRASVPVWSQVALHRPAEFNKSHIPAFLAGEEPRRMLAQHGFQARDYPDVRANTVASFALGDYEWILAFEADDLYRIVDLMRHLRGTEARLHVREEVPFYTGHRVEVGDL